MLIGSVGAFTALVWQLLGGAHPCNFRALATAAKDEGVGDYVTT